MNAPYPTDLIPLIPEFLTRRRSKFTFALRAIEELGIDRPAFSFVVDLGVTDPDGTNPARLYSPYATIHDGTRAAATTAVGAGLAEETAKGWRLTAKGRDLLVRTRRAADEYLAGLSVPLSREELSRLASALGRAFDATRHGLDRRHHDHISRAARMAGDGSEPMVALENAVYGLWQARDDCHVTAWRAAGLDGPTLDVLTRIWRREATTEEELASKLPRQRPDDVRREIEGLRQRGLVEPNALATTAAGGAARQSVEDETDRLFFAPWPDDLGTQAGWLRDHLATVNAAL